MDAKLVESWKNFKVVLNQNTLGDEFLLAVQNFRKAIDEYFVRIQCSGSAEDLIKVINELNELDPIPSDPLIVNRLDDLAIALYYCDRVFFKTFPSLGVVVQEEREIGSLLSLMYRLADMCAKPLSSNQNKFKRITDSTPEAQSIVKTYYLSVAFKDIPNKLKELETAIQHCVNDDRDGNSLVKVKVLFAEIWSNKGNIERARVYLINSPHSLSKKYIDSYMSFLLYLAEKNITFKSESNVLPLEIARSQTLSLLYKKPGFFQSIDNSTMLLSQIKAVKNAESVDMIKAVLSHIQENYKPRQGLFVIVNWIKGFLGLPLLPQTVQQAKAIQSSLDSLHNLTAKPENK